MQETYHILRNASLNGTDLEDLRVAVGWDRMEGLYEAILKKSYSHFSVTVADKLIAFVNVIRDGIRCIEVIFDPRLDRLSSLRISHRQRRYYRPVGSERVGGLSVKEPLESVSFICVARRR